MAFHCVITPIGQGHIRFQYGHRMGTFSGEMMSSGTPDYILYRNTFERWDSPHDGEVVDEATRVKMLEDVISECAKKGWAMEVQDY